MYRIILQNPCFFILFSNVIYTDPTDPIRLLNFNIWQPINRITYSFNKWQNICLVPFCKLNCCMASFVNISLVQLCVLLLIAKIHFITDPIIYINKVSEHDDTITRILWLEITFQLSIIFRCVFNYFIPTFSFISINIVSNEGQWRTAAPKTCTQKWKPRKLSLRLVF